MNWLYGLRLDGRCWNDGYKSPERARETVILVESVSYIGDSNIAYKTLMNDER